MYSEKYRLKRSINICDTEYEIRSDYGVILDIIEALNDPDLDNESKALVALKIFYPDFTDMPPEHYEEALKGCYRYVNGWQDDDGQQHPKVMDWEKDFPLVVGAVNRVLGYDVRSVPYDVKSNTGGVPWETFLSAFREIGDCTFAQVVNIRNKIRSGKKLEKYEREWYERNRDIVDLKTAYSEDEEAEFEKWSGRKTTKG